jgi:hypothetical protein
MPSSTFANFYRKAKSPIIDEEAIDSDHTLRQPFSNAFMPLYNLARF